jgi:hypothetical protein
VEKLLEAAKAEAQASIQQLNRDLAIRDATLAKRVAELEEERARMNVVGKEKVRITVEFETLTRRFDNQVKDMAKVEENLKDTKAQLQEASKKVRALTRDLQTSEENQSVMARRLESLQQQLSVADNGRTTLTREVDSLSQQIAELVQEQETVKTKFLRLNEECELAKREKEALGSSLRIAEDEVVEARRQVKLEQDKIQKLAEELEQSKDSVEECRRLRGQVSSLQEEADHAVRRCVELDKLLSAERTEVEESRFKQKRLEGELQSSRQKCETLLQEMASLREQVRREVGASRARQDAVEAAEERTQTAMAGKQALEAQLEELTTTYVRSLNDKRQTEEENIQLQAELSLAREEAESLRMHAIRSREAVSEAEKAERLTVEVECLRKQLAAMRIAMLEGDRSAEEGEDEVDKLRIETMRQKKVFEGIINSLRTELADECEERTRLQEKVKELQNQAEQSQRLSEEVEYMSLKAKRAKEDSTLAATQMSQARREELVLLQERDAAAREVIRAREQVQTAEKELDHLRGALEREKRRAERLTEECSHHERRGAEFFAAANRAEAALEAIRQEVKKKELDLMFSSQSAETTSEKLGKLQQDYLALVDAHEVLQAQHADLQAKWDGVIKQHREQTGLTEVLRREVGTRRALADEHDQHAATLKRALQVRSHLGERHGRSFPSSKDLLMITGAGPGVPVSAGAGEQAAGRDRGGQAFGHAHGERQGQRTVTGTVTTRLSPLWFTRAMHDVPYVTGSSDGTRSDRGRMGEGGEGATGQGREHRQAQELSAGQLYALTHISCLIITEHRSVDSGRRSWRRTRCCTRRSRSWRSKCAS